MRRPSRCRLRKPPGPQTSNQPSILPTATGTPVSRLLGPQVIRGSGEPRAGHSIRPSPCFLSSIVLDKSAGRSLVLNLVGPCACQIKHCFITALVWSLEAKYAPDQTHRRPLHIDAQEDCGEDGPATVQTARGISRAASRALDAKHRQGQSAAVSTERWSGEWRGHWSARAPSTRLRRVGPPLGSLRSPWGATNNLKPQAESRERLGHRPQGQEPRRHR